MYPVPRYPLNLAGGVSAPVRFITGESGPNRYVFVRYAQRSHWRRSQSTDDVTARPLHARGVAAAAT
jgi:hypothetical protein